MEKLTQDDVAAIIFRRADGKLATHVVWETAAAVIAKLNAAHPLQYAPTEPGAPLSDEEWNEFCRACGNDPEAWGWARIRLNCILAKRDTAQPAESLKADWIHCPGKEHSLPEPLAHLLDELEPK